MSWLQRFILLNALSFVLNIVIKNPFFVTYNDILEKWVISLPWKKSCCNKYMIFSSFHNGYKEPRCLTCSLFWSFSNGSTLWIGMCWCQALILKYFYMDCIPTILWKHLDQLLRTILIQVHLSMTYDQKKLWKPVSDLVVRNDFLNCFYSIFVILRLSQCYLSNMHF